MTISSEGYERAIHYDVLGEMLSHAGATYSVFSAGAFQVTAGPGAMQLSIAAGDAFGKGIYDESDATETLTGASGTRWDTVVLRRDWTTDPGATTPMLLTGNGVRAISGARLVGGGVTDDQPIALVRWAAGQTAAQEIVDLRVWHGAGGVLFAKDVLVLSYLAQLGTMVRIGASLWLRVLNGSVEQWVDVADAANLRGLRGTVQKSVQELLAEVFAQLDGAASDTTPSRLMRYKADGSVSVSDPTTPSNAANKKYVDGLFDKNSTPEKAVVRGDGGRVLFGDPVTAGNGATKRYVDGAVDAAAGSRKITNDQLRDNIVTSRVIANGAVGSAQIADDAVLLEKMSNGARTMITDSNAGRLSSEVYDRALSSSPRAVYITPAGTLGYQSSSRRYKENIEALNADEQAILAMELVQFQYIDGDGTPQQGLIAEQLDELGLDWLVIYDDEGRPESVYYERIALALLPVIQGIDRRLSKLERASESEG